MSRNVIPWSFVGFPLSKLFDGLAFHTLDELVALYHAWRSE